MNVNAKNVISVERVQKIIMVNFTNAADKTFFLNLYTLLMY